MPEEPEHEKVKRQIAEAVTHFAREQMQITPGNVLVECQPKAVVVTLQDASCPAEKRYAADCQGRHLLERFYGEVFDAIRADLDTLVGGVLGRRVRRSRLMVDPESGDGIILFALADEPCQPHQHEDSVPQAGHQEQPKGDNDG